MMRGSRSIAVAIRQPDGNIHLTVEPLKGAGSWKKIPIVRGVGSFISSLVTGTSVLMYGADVLERFEEPESTEKEKPEGIPKSAIMLSVALALVMVIALFILLPTFILGLVKKAGVESVLLLNLIEGILRICIFVGYIMLCRRVPDVRRTFEYHGAEHKTIHCYENGLPLTPENAQSFYTLHPRCGTSFMMFVMIIALLVFSLFGWPNLVVRILTRLIFIPVIAGISYEVLQWTGRHDSAVVKALSMPGILLQKITTCEPTLEQLEVAIAAMNAVLPAHEDPELPVDYWVGVQLADGTLVKNEAETEEYIASKKK